MKKENIIQFVCFETEGDSGDFFSQWDHYTKSMSDNQRIRLQHEIGKRKKTRYLSQHWCFEEEFRFNFRKERRKAQFPEVEMRIRQLGGYTCQQVQCNQNSETNESKIFVFVTNPDTNVEDWQHFSNYHFLNIYKYLRKKFIPSSNFNRSLLVGTE